ncbi:hypothetical protein [Nonomuraea glycinis]|uniref:hypothetical protein n=1 Tax=Nonomuraea glycinis TaxID=2047744 RepID=UPI00339F280D
MAVGILVGALGAGRLAARVTPRAILVGGLVLGGLGMAGLATIDPYTGYTVLLVAQLVVSMGVGAALTTIVSVTLQDVLPDPRSTHGLTSGYAAAFLAGAGLLAAAALIALIALRGSSPQRR